MKTLTIIVSLVISFIQTQGQTYKVGHRFIMDRNTSVAYKYTTSYHKSDETFITVYKIVNPPITITATHNTGNQTITVITEETDGGIFAKKNEENYTYDSLTNNVFGFTGNYAMLGGNKVPNQLALKFISNKHDYVEVKSVLGDSHEGYVEFYCFY